MLFAGITLSAGAALAALPALVAGALAWSAASTAMSSVVPNAGVASPAFLLTYFPVILVSGVLGPISGLPHWLATLASYLPAKPVIDTVGRALGHGSAFSLRDLLVLVAWAVGGLAVASARFRWEPVPASAEPGRPGAAARGPVPVSSEEGAAREGGAYRSCHDWPPAGNARTGCRRRRGKRPSNGERSDAAHIKPGHGPAKAESCRQCGDRGGTGAGDGGLPGGRPADGVAAGQLRHGRHALPRYRYASAVRGGGETLEPLPNGRPALPQRRASPGRDLRLHPATKTPPPRPG